MTPRRLQSLVLLSIAAALVTLALKAVAYFLTSSVGVLSDAVESVVNLAAAVTAYFSLRYAAKPVDDSHTYGHEKIEFFSSGLEGVLILLAALTIAWYSVQRLIGGNKPEALGAGMSLLLLSSVINGVVAQILLHFGRKQQSIVLEADGRHLMTDVWTSAGVLAGLSLVWVTEWAGNPIYQLDPIIALVVAVIIVWTAYDLMRRSFNGLMDHALPEVELAKVREAIQSHLGQGMTYHALRTRQAGSHRFVDFHLLVPGRYTVQHAHSLTEIIENAVRATLPNMEVSVHIEPIEEPASWQDSALLPVEEAARREQNR
jgi:cation diffusion facilitator family transporter